VPVVSGVLVIVLVGLSTRGASAYYSQSEKEDWRGLAAMVASQWQPGDEVLFYVPWTNQMFDFYLKRLEGDVPEVDIDSVMPYPAWNILTHSSEEGKREAIMRRLPLYVDRVWLVQGRVFTPERLQARNTILAALACKYQPVETRRFTEFSKVEVVLFEHKETSDTAGQSAEECNELSIIRALQSNIIEDFENADDVGVYWGRGTKVNARLVPGVKGQGYIVQFAEAGWWDIVKVTPPADPSLYQGVSLALRGSGDVRLQLRERPSPDGRGGEQWSVAIELTEDWRNLSYAWSDFRKEATSPQGNGVLDLDLVGSMRLKQGDNTDGFVATDQWVFKLADEERVNSAVLAK
jgi:Carbohydrate binding domain (family 11)